MEVVVADRSPDADAGRLAEIGVEVHLGTEEESLLEGVELVVKSPGVPAASPLAAAARARGIPIWSEVELGYRLLHGNPLRRRHGHERQDDDDRAARRDRSPPRDGSTRSQATSDRPLTEVAGRSQARSTGRLRALELPARGRGTLACDVAVLLNLEPDHLDRHGTFEAYRDAKLRIFERARAKVVPRGLGLDGIEFAADDPLPAEPLIPGAHNRENAAAATAAARAAGVGDDAIAEALRTFPGVPHRLELVRELRGVRYVNDSKATNTAAARRGVAAYDAPLRLILGGSLKGENFMPFAQELPENVRSIYLIGEASDQLAVALDAAGRSYSRDGDLGRALAHASADAEAGDVVLLSPAAASFDQFDDFEQRGDAFRRLAEELA